MGKAFIIADIITRYFRDEISETEQLQLNMWLLEDPENRKLFDSLTERERLTADFREYIGINTETLKSKIFQFSEQEKPVSSEVSELQRPTGSIARTFKFHLKKSFKYAAAILVILMGGTWYLVSNRQKPSETPAASEIVHTSDILPGGNRAMLRLADGSVISLDNAKDGALAKQGSISVIKRTSGRLEYSHDKLRGQDDEKLMMNTITTPKGGQYNLTLPDGTRMWLNAASSVTFPAEFKGNERAVSITGEVYFEVQKMEGKPFVVNYGTGKVIVTGTKFNINAYRDEASSKTSLLEGSVNVNGSVLKPGQAYSDGKIFATEIEQDIAWKNGFFNFKDSDLPAVMRQLARWYDLDVRYAGRIPEKEFQGKMGRDLKLSQVLVILEKMKVNFTRAGRVVTIESD